MKNIKLSQSKRLVVAFIYLALVFLSVSILGGNLLELVTGSTDESLWFYSGILLIIMGQYVTEPFFSTPSDALANSISAILALICINSKKEFSGYWILFIGLCILSALSVLTMIVKDKDNKFSKALYFIVSKIGNSKVLFSFIYLLSAYNFFFKTNKINYLVVSLVIWMCITFFHIAEIIVDFFSKLFKIMKEKSKITKLGKLVKSNNKSMLIIDIPKGKVTSNDLFNRFVVIKNSGGGYNIGIIIDIKNHIDSYWGIVILLSKENENIIVPSSFILNSNSSIENDSVYLIDFIDLPSEIQENIKTDYMFNNIKDFVGYIQPESDINIINFSICSNKTKIKEGSIVKVNINGRFVLYQVINGITKEIVEDHNNDFGFISAKARKLGEYDYKRNTLTTIPWVPDTNERVFLNNNIAKEIDFQGIAKNSIGRLPETDMQIPIKDINSLVTHNTAVLGILGIGKSCLTFELIKKILDNSKCKVICIDITNQYYSENGLFKYVSQEIICNDIGSDNWKELDKSSKKRGDPAKASEWGNVNEYKALVSDIIESFFGSEKERVLVVNPDNHNVTKAASYYNIQESIALSVVEKTRIISEQILNYCMNKGITDYSRCCIVLEEAHSLVPEWNSVSAQGDTNATNGTAKVILQGRKYGLGCILVTQRTANVTKSILNQCNTIFALRVYDDTGKSFLENYIGNDYSSALPTLEERHAIAIGKSLGLKQPVILQLNDRKYFCPNHFDEK